MQISLNRIKEFPNQFFIDTKKATIWYYDPVCDDIISFNLGLRITKTNHNNKILPYLIVYEINHDDYATIILHIAKIALEWTTW